MIQEVLNKAAAIELFEKEAIVLGTSDVVPFYRAIELFGEEAARFLDENAFIDGYVNCGVDWSGMGACSVERPFTGYLYKAGFLKVVTEHNYLRVIKAHKESEGGQIFDRYREERDRRLDELDAENERKRAERKAKRAAAKAAREAAEKEKGVNSYSYPAFVVLFNLGMRIGEMAALTWEVVNFKENTITINKTVNRYRKADYGFTMAVASPKSKTSIRTVTMNSVVRKTLLKLKMQSVPTAAKLPYVDDSGNIRGHISGFLFVNTSGNVWNEPGFRELIKRIVERHNKDAEENHAEKIENFCPHMVRHTYTSLAYSAGADVKIVSQNLGHASASVTLDTYTHLAEDNKERAGSSCTDNQNIIIAVTIL